MFFSFLQKSLWWTKLETLSDTKNIFPLHLPYNIHHSYCDCTHTTTFVLVFTTVRNFSEPPEQFCVGRKDSVFQTYPKVFKIKIVQRIHYDYNKTFGVKLLVTESHLKLTFTQYIFSHNPLLRPFFTRSGHFLYADSSINRESFTFIVTKNYYTNVKMRVYRVNNQDHSIITYVFK